MRLLPSVATAASLSAAAVLAASATTALAQTPPPSRTASELAAALQQKYAGIKDFTADFTQTARAGVLNRQLTERGRVMIKKPGKMRWTYTSPETKEFVSDGVKLYTYIPQDKQVIVSAVPPADQAATPALFLAGKGNLTRDFTASFTEPPPGTPTGTRALKLVPKTPQRDYDWLVLAVDADTLSLRALQTRDAQGGTSTFTFTNLKENVGLADTLFAFEPPRGVDVVTDAPR